MTTTTKPILVGSNVQVEKGCRDLGVKKHMRATVKSITELGADYSHQVKVVLEFKFPLGNGRGSILSLYATHLNRLSDAEPALLGNVSGQRIKVKVL